MPKKSKQILQNINAISSQVIAFGKAIVGKNSKYGSIEAVDKVLSNNVIYKALKKLNDKEQNVQNDFNEQVLQQSTNDTTCNLISTDFNIFNDIDAENNSNYYLKPKQILCETPAFKSLLTQLNSNAKIMVSILDFSSQTTTTNNAVAGFTGIMVRVNGQLIGLDQYNGTLVNVTQFEIQTYSRNNIGIGDVLDTIVHEVAIHAADYFNQLSSIVNNSDENAFNNFRTLYQQNLGLTNNPINTINDPSHNIIRNFSTTTSNYKSITIAILDYLRYTYYPKKDYKVIFDYSIDDNYLNLIIYPPNSEPLYAPKSMYNKYLEAVNRAIQTYNTSASGSGIPWQYVSKENVKFKPIYR
jgi:hypothetical protein